VKHRGFRIELGEVENALASQPLVQTVAVVLSTFTDLLEAYVVVKNNAEVQIKELRQSLNQLPSYMHPEAFYFLTAEEMPRLPSGKINVKALQDISEQLASRNQEGMLQEKASVMTTTTDNDSQLSILLGAMADIFPQAKDITPQSDFFDELGGHSLSAALLVSKLRIEGPEGSPVRRLSLQHIYLHRTAEKIIACLIQDSPVDKYVDKENNHKNESAKGHWPVSRARYILCGLAQVPALLFLFLIQSLGMFGPYFAFYLGWQTGSLRDAIISAYLVFVTTPILKTGVALMGKWIVLGRAKAGEYSLYGVYYYRWWLAEHLVALIDMRSVAETPLLPAMMRCLGAHVGSHCHINPALVGAAYDLVWIGEDVVLGKDAALSTSWIERGRLILAPIRIDSCAFVGSQTVVEGDTHIEEGGELGPMTMLARGSVIPPGERWVGSPARFHYYATDVGNMRASRPSFARRAAMTITTTFTTVFILPMTYFVPQIPGILLFQYLQIPGIWSWVQTAIVAVPAAASYLVVVVLQLVVLRWVILGKVKERSYHTYSGYAYRKWFLDRLMDLSLVILHPVYATLYVVPFLRSLGVKIGHMAEVSTARGIDFELTEIGDESFIADGVLVGDRNVRANTITLRKTKLNSRAFAGNSSILPQGTELPSESLVGVLSIAPETPLKPGQSCFGSPPVLMPGRQRTSTNYPDHLLYAPRWTQIALRLFIEGMRILLPRVLIVFGLGYGVQLFALSYHTIDVSWVILLIPLFYFFCKC
jgi:non-ribosomal peptide synthetase-like protein